MRNRPAAELTPGTRPRGPVAETRQSGMNRELHIVGFQIGRETYGVPITSLHEIVRVPEITAVPDAPDYMEGVINLRGKIVSVIDLRKRLGAKEVVSEQAQPDSGGRAQRTALRPDGGLGFRSVEGANRAISNRPRRYFRMAD